MGEMSPAGKKERLPAAQKGKEILQSKRLRGLEGHSDGSFYFTGAYLFQSQINASASY